MNSNIVIEADEPRLAGTGISIAAVVRACHDKTVGPGLIEFTRMWRAFSSSVQARAKLRTAALLAA